MDKNELTFEQRHMMAFLELRNNERQMEVLKERSETIREQLVKGMEENGIKSIDNEYVTITYVAPTEGKPKLDEKTWKAEDPDGYRKVFNMYNKMSGKRQAYVRIKTK